MAREYPSTRGRPDIVVFDARLQPQLIVEAKSKTGTTPRWASRFRRNLLAHGAVSPTNYFLLALPDRFYFWDHHSGQALDAPPSYEADAYGALGPYFRASGVDPSSVRGSTFELIVLGWLSELIRSAREGRATPPELDWVRRSGLWDVLKNSHVEREAA